MARQYLMLSLSGYCISGIHTTGKFPSCAAFMPFCESSITKQCSAATLKFAAHLRNISGSGFDLIKSPAPIIN